MRVNAMRRAGELIGIPADGDGYVYPSWQFGPDWKPLPIVRRLVARSRSRGIRDADLVRLLGRRVGLMGDESLLDLVLAGREGPVLAAIDSAGA
ncbi:MAG: hypothetical protein QOE36_2033 [Gaiellaceae bacterium]|nr:hypothetical protein [Gaiellaceae bacterium]